MSRTHVYAVATITPKALSRLLTLNLLPRCEPSASLVPKQLMASLSPKQFRAAKVQLAQRKQHSSAQQVPHGNAVRWQLPACRVV
jgi:hypothetical protein